MKERINPGSENILQPDSVSLRPVAEFVRICLFNLAVVACLGVMMRYKIGFSFPWLDQKHLQLGHYNFAFTGWVSLVLMVLMVDAASRSRGISFGKYRKYFFAQLINAWGLLISFILWGHGVFSGLFSVSSIAVMAIFTWQFVKDTRNVGEREGLRWFHAALLYNLVSALGSFYLSYLMTTRHPEQHIYLATIYWFLHFQYNGWFFFACAGLFIDHLQRNGITSPLLRWVFRLFFWSCIPAYGLSVLWMNLPLWIFVPVAVAAGAQVVGLILFFWSLPRKGFGNLLKLEPNMKWLYFSVAVAISVKLMLQAGSTIPSVSKFAFGFRPVVIAYLHLALLAFTTVFLLIYIYINRLIRESRITSHSMLFFAVGVFVTETILAIQGVASISYTVVPFVNESLFAVSVCMFIALVVLNVFARKKA